MTTATATPPTNTSEAIGGPFGGNCLVADFDLVSINLQRDPELIYIRTHMPKMSTIDNNPAHSIWLVVTNPFSEGPVIGHAGPLPLFP